MLKLGTCLYNFIWENSLPDAIRRAASSGFGAVEIMATWPQLDPRRFLQGHERKEVHTALEETGVHVVSLNPTFIDWNLASRSEVIRQETVKEIKACVDAAVDLGAELVVVGAGRRHPLVLEPIEMSNALAHPAIRECIDYAESKGVVYGFENISSLYMDHCDDIAAFIDKMDTPYCKAVFDAANARWTRQDPGDAARTLGSRIGHVHLSDGDGSCLSHWPIGRGDIDFGQIAAALREVDYRGWSFLETTWMEAPDWAIESSVKALRPHGWQVVPASRQSPTA
jgi:L-ribulose-5-phosphate 3-epimerase